MAPDPESTFGLQLILAEEMREARSGGSNEGGLAPLARGREPPAREAFIIDQNNHTDDRPFHIKDTSGRSLPVEGRGELKTALVVAGSKDYDIVMRVDGVEVVDNSFANLQDDSTELERLSAYERGDGKSVFHASGYEFNQSVDVVIVPGKSITFDRLRAEIDLLR